MTWDVGSEVVGFAKNIGKIMENFGPDTVSGMAKGGVDLTAEAAVLVNDGDQVKETMKEISKDENEN